MAGPSSLEQVGRDAEAKLYPRHVLKGCETALILFAAGFHGRQDGYWIARAGLQATCVDHDERLLGEMQAVYPRGWDFIVADAYAWVESAVGKWDVVSIDCPSGHFDRCADLLPTWTRLASRAVILGAGPDHDRIVEPAGWPVTEIRFRSMYEGGVYWAVLESA